MPATQEYTSISPLSPEGFIQFQRAIETLAAPVLRSEIVRLQNSTFHLRRSNTELELAAQEEGDNELHEYILENEDVIRANTIKISLLQNELRVRDAPRIPESSSDTSATENVTDHDLDPTAPNGSVPNGSVATEGGVFL